MSPLLLPVALLTVSAAPFVASTDARVQKAAGDALRQRGENAAALVAYRNAVAIEPRYAEAHEAMGEVQYAARSYAASAESFSRAVEIDPGYALAWYNLGHVSRKSGALERARTAYERFVALTPSDPDGRLALADTLRGLGDGAAAAREYKAFVELAAGSPDRASDLARAREALAALPPPAPASAPMPSPASTVVAAVPAAPAAPQAPVAATAPVQAAGASAALADKLAQGDRLVASGDHRGALFAYQDAVYLDPRNAGARVKLGKAYASLRYPDQAKQQYAQALAIDPENAEARRAMQEAQRPSPGAAAAWTGSSQAARTAPSAPTAGQRPAFATVAVGTVAAGMVASGGAAPVTSASLPRVYRLPEGQPTEGPMQAPRPVGPDSEPTAVAKAQDAPPAQPVAAGPTARERYKAALALMASREYAKAIAELDDAIAQEPRMAVAFAARASAQFGLGKYRESADDYRAALGLAPQMGTPLYGLGECHRILGEPAAAADYYAQYSQSPAPDVREDLREVARKRAAELGR